MIGARELDCEAQFLSCIFDDLPANVIQEVLAQFSNLEEAYLHLQEFKDLGKEEIDVDEVESPKQVQDAETVLGEGFDE